MPKLSPTVEEIEALRKDAPDGPVVMINLLKFRPDGEREAFMEYMKIAATVHPADKPPGRMLYSGVAGKDVADNEDWDFVLLGEYHDFDTGADFMVHPIY